MDAAMNPATEEDLELGLLLEALYRKYHCDFRGYALPSLRRRLGQAMLALGFETIGSLHERLLHDASLLPRLLRYLTVQVSEFFRDPGYFLAVRQQVVPALRPLSGIKVWVAGCGDGEELYSLAILFKEEGLLSRTIFYATDISTEALKRAATGLYPLERIPLYTANHRLAGGHGSLSEHYTAAYDMARFDPKLRQNTVFADHNVVTDDVFAEMQLISCRNVLIYFTRPTQDRVLGLFRRSLAMEGFLGLGNKESLRFSGQSHAFADVVPEQRIYKRCA
jgi:chemotaxis protein methyltransferase CheR